MASPFLFSGSVPGNYDQYLGPLLFEPYALDMAERLQRLPLTAVLELACGTGRVSRHVWPLVPPHGHYVATDVNADMLQLAQQLLPNARVTWAVANAMELPYADESFSAVFCQFGLMFFPDKAQSFAEVHRVLQPGGLYLFNVWDDVAQNPRSQMLDGIMREVFGAEAPDLLGKGPYSYHDKNVIEQAVLAAGFSSLHIETVVKSGVYEQAADVVAGFVDGSPLSAFLADKPAEKVAAVKGKLLKSVEAHQATHGHNFPLQALVCTAVK